MYKQRSYVATGILFAIFLLFAFYYLPVFSVTSSSSKILQSDESLFPFRPTYTKLIDHPRMDSDPHWSPDGSEFIFSSMRDTVNWYYLLYKMSFVDSSIIRIKTSAELVDHSAAKYSPSGKQIAFAGSIRNSAREVFIMDVSTGSIKRVTYDNGLVIGLNWAPDEQSIIYRWIESIFTDKTKLRRVNVSDGHVQRYFEGDIFEALGTASFSPDGEKIAFSGQEVGDPNYHLYLYDEVTKEIIKYTNAQENDLDPAWSPDGRWIVFNRGGYGHDLVESCDLYICAPEVGIAKKLTQTKNNDTNLLRYYPAWSPTGHQLLYTTQAVGHWQLTDIWLLTDFLPDTPYLWLISHEIDDSEGNNNGIAESGELVELPITFVNKGVDASNVVFTVTSDNPNIEFVKNTYEVKEIKQDQQIVTQDPPIQFFAKALTVFQQCEINIHITGDDSYEQNEIIEIKIGDPIFLVIDEGVEGYAQSYTKPLVNNECLYEQWNISQNGIQQDMLSDRSAVIWTTGIAYENTLSIEEQTLLRGYLDSGGKLLLVGNNIGNDLAGGGNSEELQFLADYLHAQYIEDYSNNQLIRGNLSDPITRGLNFYLNEYHSDTPDAPDVIAAIPPAQSIFTYGSEPKIAGIKYFNEVTGSQIVFLPFGLEEIIDSNYDRTTKLLKNIINWWLTPTSSTSVRSTSSNKPETLLLAQNYPNPFNSETIIEYHIPNACQAKLKVYNLLGQEIRVLVDQHHPPGHFRAKWDGRDSRATYMPAGVYLYTLETDDHFETKKTLLLK